MQAISDRHYEMMHPTRPTSSLAVAASTSAALRRLVPAPSDRMAHVYITVPPANFAKAHKPPGYPQNSSTSADWTTLSSSPLQCTETQSLRNIDSTVTFRSSSAQPLLSSCCVYHDGTPVHIDPPAIMDVRHATEEGQKYLHQASLVPGYWDTLCNSNGARLYGDISWSTLTHALWPQICRHSQSSKRS